MSEAAQSFRERAGRQFTAQAATTVCSGTSINQTTVIADIRRCFGFRECSVGDADKAAEWLAANVCEKERQVGQVREDLVAHLKGERIEPPTRDRVRRIIGTALRQAEQALTARIASRVLAEGRRPDVRADRAGGRPWR